MRTITTVTELGALPTRSVVLDKYRRAWQLRHRWVCNDINVNGIYIPTDFGPVTVLHDPGKQSRPSADDEQVERIARQIAMASPLTKTDAIQLAKIAQALTRPLPDREQETP